MKLLLQKLKFRTRYDISRAIYFYLFFFVFILFSQTAISQVCTSEAVEVGYRDYYYGKNVTPKVTAEKPESKLWYNNGWWGVLWDPDNKVFRIQQFDLAKQCWQNVGPDVDDRPQSAADVFWDGQKLYIASHANADHKSGSQNARLYRYRYDENSNSYTLDNGFPVDMNNKKSETLVITKDSTGQLWATWTQRGKVYVNRSLSDDKTWGLPFLLPVDHVSTSRDDISSVTLFGNGDIGVMWSNQNDKKIYFSVHKVNNADDDWEPTETALAGVNAAPVADDHINLAATCAGDGSTVVAVTKSSLRNATDPQIYLLKRDPAGNWSNHTVATDKEGHTRPIVLCQANSDKVFVFLRAKKPVRSRIYLKTANLANPKFKEGMGEIFIDSRDDNDVNNPTSTKQHINPNTGILVLASDDTHLTYLHNLMNLDGGPDTFLLTTSVSPPGGGSIERDPAQTHFEDGDLVKLTAKAETGFVFDNWSGDMGSADASSQTITLTMDQNRSVVAHFSEIPVADIDVDPTAHDYGTVAAGDNASHRFKVTNIGTANLQISSVSLSGSNPNVFSIDSGGGAFDLNPSESQDIVVSFRPNSDDMKSAILRVISSDPDESELDIPLLGNQPLPLCEPGVNLALNGEATASSGSRRVHQGIDGDLDSSWKSDRLRARNKQQWYQIDFLQTVAIGQVVIRWTTNRHAKSYFLQVSNDGDNWTDIFNQTNGDNIIEEVSGLNALGRYLRLFMTENNRSRYGIRELEIFCSNDPPPAGQPDIAIKPDKHNFGSLDIGGSASKTLVVSNDGTKQLHVSDIFLTGSNKNEFVIASGGGAVNIDPGQSHDVVVKFLPASEGDKQATLRIESDDPDENPLDASLSGTGTDTGGADSNALRLNPTEDAYVRSSKATKNYGRRRDLQVKQTRSDYNGYLKFSVTTSDPIQSATLRLYVLDRSVDGGSLYSVSNLYKDKTAAWDEDDLIWDNAPEIDGSAIAVLGKVDKRTWVEMDLSAVISGPGTYSFALTSDSKDRVKYSSKEGKKPPELVLTTDPVGAPKMASAGTQEGTADLSDVNDEITELEKTLAPDQFALQQNYPNPFNPSTTIHYDLPEASKITLAIYNLRGQLIQTLVSGALRAGRHKVVWNGRNAQGIRVASGVYIYQLKAQDFVATKRLVLTK